ncbi:MAG: adenosine deaminase [Ignavibacteriae bacterium]|nr:adenosine deaminase [Ignavibacteria bacterium]MBI3364219.1 adenosine deaminase [Ignavibacteriota bacterium]
MTSSMKLTEKFIRTLPKALLHDHLDGGVRPQTVIELAKDIGYKKLPTTDSVELHEWFQRGAKRGSLPLYLEGFAHTTAVMQTEEALERVAYEMMEDMHNDNVVYVETRFSPIFHTEKGLHWEEIVSAVLRGLEHGKNDFDVEYGLIICAMRNMTLSQEMAELAIDFRERGVVGFDLAGEEGGYPPKKHVDAFHYIQRENFNITIHAGEAFGKESIWQAIQWCGAHRIGHATRLIEDMKVADDDPTEVVSMGYLAQYVLDKRIPLEMCLTSNVDTGAVKSIEEHPFRIYYRYKFRVTLNTDDRLMSNTTMTKELKLAHDAFGLTVDEIEKLTINAMKSAFIPYKKRIELIYNVIKPGYQVARHEKRPTTSRKKGRNT